MAKEQWICESCGTVNLGEVKGIIKCRGCGEVYVVERDEQPKRTSEEWLASINQLLTSVDRRLAEAEKFREKEKKVLSDIEVLIRRYR